MNGHVAVILVMLWFALAVVTVATPEHKTVQTAEISITVLPEEPGTPVTCWNDTGVNNPEITTDCGVVLNG